MVPLSDYATVSKDATLSEAVAALKESQACYDHKYPHRAVLVYDEKNDVVGKVSFIHILRTLEPKYDEMLSDNRSLHMGFTRKFQKAMLEQLKLWDAPLERICQKAAKIKVSSFMARPTEGEYVDAESTLDEVIHQLVMGHHQSLLVMEGKRIVGIVRLVDVFEIIANEIASCEI